jgi:hypothetical protein
LLLKESFLLFLKDRRFSRRAALLVVLSAMSVGTAAAGTVHRFSVSQSTGSNGSTNFLQGSTTGSALEGNVGTADTGINIPFGVLGAYDVASTSSFGIGVLGISTTGYGVASEALGANPSVLAYAGGGGPALEAAIPSTSSGAAAMIAQTSGVGSAIVAISSPPPSVVAQSTAYPQAVESLYNYGAGAAIVATSNAPLNAAYKQYQPTIFGQNNGAGAAILGLSFAPTPAPGSSYIPASALQGTNMGAGPGVVAVNNAQMPASGASDPYPQPAFYAGAQGAGAGVVAIASPPAPTSTSAPFPQPAMYAENRGYGDGLDVQADGGAVPNCGTGCAVTSLSVYAPGAGYGIVSTTNTGPFSLVAQTIPLTSGVAEFGGANGLGGAVYGNSGGSKVPAFETVDAVGGTDLLGAYTCSAVANGYCSTNVESFIVQSGTGNRSGSTVSSGSDVQVSGDLYVSGQVFQACKAFPAVPATTSCAAVPVGSQSTSVARSANGTNVPMYGSQQRARTVEDFGTAQLFHGVASVHLDPQFAQTISTTTPYLVFLTPDGDCRGLFTATKTPEGFEVRELGGGRSNLAFDYRIVAKPFGDSATQTVAIARRAVGLGADPAVHAQLAAIRSMRAHATRRRFTGHALQSIARVANMVLPPMPRAPVALKR